MTPKTEPTLTSGWTKIKRRVFTLRFVDGTIVDIDVNDKNTADELEVIITEEVARVGEKWRGHRPLS